MSGIESLLGPECLFKSTRHLAETAMSVAKNRCSWGGGGEKHFHSGHTCCTKHALAYRLLRSEVIVDQLPSGHLLWSE